MRHRSFRALALAGALASCALAVPAQSGAFVVGIGDQKASTFSDPLFRALKVKRTRLIVAYNAALKPGEAAQIDQWMAAARAARLEVVVAFNPDTSMRCPASPCAAPSVAAYTKAVRAFHKRWGRSVRIYQPWNESNSRTQPTAGTGRGAKLVAKYYKALRKVARGRLVTGADIQDIGDFVGYTRAFLRAAGRPPAVMGFHNYTDTNRFFFRSTDKFVKAMPRRTKVWLTETGAIFSFTQQSGVVSLAPDEGRAARSMSHMFKIARRYRRKIERLYIYQWSVNFAGDRFDAGIVNPDGTPRKSYEVVRKNRKLIR